MSWKVKVWSGNTYLPENNIPDPARDEIAEEFVSNALFITLHDSSVLRVLPENSIQEPVPIRFTFYKQLDNKLYNRLRVWEASGSLLKIIPHVGEQNEFFSGSFTRVRRTWSLKRGWTGPEKQYFNLETEFNIFNIEDKA